MKRRSALVTLAVLAVCVASPASPASAGRLIATGHDADHHCGRDKEGGARPPHLQCHFFRAAVEFARGGAPEPSKPVLVLDRGLLDVRAALDQSFGAGVVPRVVVDPRSSAFRSTPITTDRYSAVIVASSGGDPADPTQQDLNEVGSAPDSDAINARAGDLRAFFDAGGGLYVNSGNVHGDEPGDPYYGFLPVTVRSARVTEPFTLSEFGRSLGFGDDDVGCCPTHSTFEAPSPGTALRAVDTDAAGRVVTLAADTPRFTAIGEPPVSAAEVQTITQSLPSTASCVRRRSVTLRLKRARDRRYSRATVYLNGKRVKRLTGARVTRPIKIAISARSKVAKVRIVIVTAGGRRVVVRRTYRVCT